jgi:hypothetical protein
LKKSKYEQDLIVFKWFKYSLFLKKGQSKFNLFCLPYINDGTADIVKTVCEHLNCTRGLQFLLDLGRRRYQSIWKALTFTGVMPAHKATGKMNYNSIVINEHNCKPLQGHFEYLSNLGEVRATKVVSTLVDGIQGRVNCNDASNVTYLPILMGYHSCYKQYMQLLGYNVRSTGMGKLVVEGEDGKEVDSGEFVSFPTYFYMWKRDFPNLKVSRPVEDICPYCYAFANCHRYLANCSYGGRNEGGNKGGEHNNDDLRTKAEMTARTSPHGLESVDFNPPELESTREDEERELMLLEAAMQIKMARAQRSLYQAKVELAV